jgi:outer membrane protein
MKGSATAASLVLMLSAATLSAQTPAPKPAQGASQPAQPPAQPKPAAPAPSATPPVTQPPAQPPAPFPAGAKIAFFQPEIVFQSSADGKAALARVQALVQKKQTENAEKAKALQANQQKLDTSGSVLNDAARAQLAKEIERQQKEAERFQQDAQAEINELQQEVQNDFAKKLQPMLEQIATEKGLHLVFNARESGLSWAAAGLDLTPELIKKLDAATKPAAPATPKP